MRLVIISFFLSTTFYVTRFLVAISGLSLFHRACGDEGEREREISGNKRIKNIEIEESAKFYPYGRRSDSAGRFGLFAGTTWTYGQRGLERLAG